MCHHDSLENASFTEELTGKALVILKFRTKASSHSGLCVLRTQLFFTNDGVVASGPRAGASLCRHQAVALLLHDADFRQLRVFKGLEQ